MSIHDTVAMAMYREGWADAVEETLKQLEGTSEAPDTKPYSGPIPDELRAWILVTRERLPA